MGLIRRGNLGLAGESNSGDQIKSQVAGTKNTGGREGGAITSGALLAEFAGVTPARMIPSDAGMHPLLASGKPGIGRVDDDQISQLLFSPMDRAAPRTRSTGSPIPLDTGP